jgi:protein-tyrosine phosphatase
VRILFVCLGNICRSPTAEAVMRAHVAAAGRADQIEVDSAGTGGWHVGDPPDARARAAAHRRGFALTGTARQVDEDDFEEFDVIVAMDRNNVRDLRRLAPPGTSDKIRPLAAVDVPDPYYGGADSFDEVLDIVDVACRELLDELVADLAR